MRRAHRETYDGAKDRVIQFAKAGPGGTGESVQCSIFSPGPVADGETIWRLVTSPTHVSAKKPYPLPTVVSHMFSKGASVQRANHSTPREVVRSIEAILSSSDKASWVGYLSAEAGDLRSALNAEGERILCIYDTADPYNCGHAEFAVQDEMPEADRLEATAEILRRLGAIRPRTELMAGAVWNGLSQGARDRPVDAKLHHLL